jgi:hypothetical protein
LLLIFYFSSILFCYFDFVRARGIEVEKGEEGIGKRKGLRIGHAMARDLSF